MMLTAAAAVGGGEEIMIMMMMRAVETSLPVWTREHEKPAPTYLPVMLWWPLRVRVMQLKGSVDAKCLYYYYHYYYYYYHCCYCWEKWTQWLAGWNGAGGRSAQGGGHLPL